MQRKGREQIPNRPLVVVNPTKGTTLNLIELAAILILSVAFSHPAFAQYVYTYTGNNYDFFASEGPNSFNGSEHLTFSFETDALYTNGAIPLSSIGPWSQSDGLTGTSGTGIGSFSNLSLTYFQTDNNGFIINWFYDYGFSAHAFVSDSQPELSSVGHIASYAGDYVQEQYSPPNYFAAGSDSVGTWTVTAAPEPSTYSMLCMGLALLAVKRK